MTDAYAPVAAFWERDNKHCRSMSHWRQTITDPTWLRLGEHCRKCVDFLMEMTGEPEPDRILEWGVGGGANAAQFPAARYYAVDLSFDNLAEAERQYRGAGGTDFQSLPVPVGDPESIGVLVADCDLFLSTYVFQHFPDNEYGERVMRIAFDVLRPGALALVQVRTDVQENVNRPYAERFTHAATWTETEFTDLLTRCGFRTVFARYAERPTGYLFFGAQKTNTQEAA